MLALAAGLYCLAAGATGPVGALRHPELRENLLQSLIVRGIGSILVFWSGSGVADIDRRFFREHANDGLQ